MRASPRPRTAPAAPLPPFPTLSPASLHCRHTTGALFVCYNGPRNKPAVRWVPDDASRLLAAMVTAVRAAVRAKCLRGTHAIASATPRTQRLHTRDVQIPSQIPA